MLLDDFKKMVDRYPATIPSDNLSEAYSRLSLDSSKGCSREQVTKKLCQNIKEALRLDKSATEKISKTGLLKLQSELIYRHLLYGEYPAEYLKTLKVINDSCGRDADYFPPFSEKDKWGRAITHCKNFNKLSPSASPVPSDKNNQKLIIDD